MFKGIDHIGIVVKDIEIALPLFQGVMGLKLLGIEVIAEDNVKVASLAIGESRIELIEPIKEGTPVFRFLEKRGEGVHHIALRVEDAKEAIGRLKEAGLEPVEGRSQTGAMGLVAAFIHPRSCHGVLMEVCEELKPRGKREDGHL
ncbi:MAG: methylmalonyl-CoA epimerase [Nitrospirota bacterium]